MKRITSFFPMIACFMSLAFVLPSMAAAGTPSSEAAGIERSEPTEPDRQYCAGMIRFGREAFQRGRYQDAKQFFRQAIEADRTNSKAWLYYDRSVIFALAEKVEQGSGLLAPGRSLATSGAGVLDMQVDQTAASVMPLSEEGEEEEVEDEEGC